MSTDTQAAANAKPKTVEVDIAMTDGRIVTFAGKRQMLKESFVKDGQVSVRLDFRNSETRIFELPAALLNKFAAHGAEQKLGDEIAGLTDIDDAVLAVDELIARLNAGTWSVKREGNGMAGTSILVRALAEAKGLDVATVKAFLAKKNQAEKIALRNNPSIKPIVERLEAEKASKGSKVDTDAMLAELGGGEPAADAADAVE